MTFPFTISTETYEYGGFMFLNMISQGSFCEDRCDDRSYPHFIHYIINVVRISLRDDLQQSLTEIT